MKYHSIQSLRCLAVISVLILHSHIAINQELYRVPFFSDFGWIGVRLFFVISGFIICERIDRETSLGRYLLKRYMRVFPLYALVTCVSVLIGVVMAASSFHLSRTDSGAAYGGDSVLYFLKSLFIVPQDDWPVFMVGWSLEYEVVFYFLFGAAYFCFGRRMALVVMLVLSGVGLMAPGLARPVLDSFFVYFLFGCLAREILVRDRELVHRLAPAVAAASGAVWLLDLYGVAELPPGGFVLASGACFAALIVFCVGLEKRGRAFRGRGLAGAIGDMSYSLYLVHWLVIPIARELGGGAAFTALEAEVWRLSVIAAALGASWAVWRYVEGPLNRRALAYASARLASLRRRVPARLGAAALPARRVVARSPRTAGVAGAASVPESRVGEGR